VQFRLLQQCRRNRVDPLRPHPAITRFISLLQSRLAEFKAAGITPEQFAVAVTRLGDEPRLTELAGCTPPTSASSKPTAGPTGPAWLVARYIDQSGPPPVFASHHLFVDGFDSFTPPSLNFWRRWPNRPGSWLSP
jgi:hypothetical protein